ncbi:hypothetical protein BBJ29_003741 [Phytophthora kernoviae]|uniref:Cyclic nucleotide-binding domain-containing protein n=1 Tax=Phytophthora kernoviae TaxID=325452 RepID=A0A3F2RKN8_9STRA|nr:hypothetical protein BBP00_00006599 [Phytophthora kernoviae]RLN71786.1 hypothetical protein BBJ29_003741 [Phytophthora kernoviae]
MIATKKRLKSMFNKGQRSDATVSPEEILSARKLDGEVGRFTLRHESSPRYAWDLLIMVMILIDVILTPLSLGFNPPPMFTAVEQISVACFMLIGNILQASVFGSVAVLISSFDEDEAAYNKKIITTSERCHFLGIPDSLAKRIRGYYENLWRETKSISSDADAFINELSPALICEVKFQLYRDMIKRIPFLSANTLSSAVIEMLILHLRTVIYMQDDILIRKGEFGDWMGFIGSKGSVGVLDPTTDTRKIIRILRKGDYFGEMALLQRAKRSTTAVALTWVQIHVLCRNDLDSVKEQYPTQTEILESEINKYMQSKVQYK